MCCPYCEELSSDLKNGLRTAKPLKIIVIFHLILLSLTLSIFSIYVECRPINDAPSVFVLGSCVFFFMVSIIGIFMSFIHEFWSMIIIMSMSATTFALGLGIIVPISKDYSTQTSIKSNYITLIWLNFGIIFNSVFTYLVCLHYQIVFVFAPDPLHQQLHAIQEEEAQQRTKQDIEDQINALMMDETLDPKLVLEESDETQKK